MTPGTLTAALCSLPEPAALRPLWEDLDRRADASFFQSWHWIGTWLACLKGSIPLRLVTVKRGGALVGLGILAQRTVWRHGFLPSRALFLNCTGDPRLDEITIEHNGFLAEAGSEADVAHACMDLLLTQRGWDELFLDGVKAPDLLEALPLGSARMRQRSRGPSHYVDLAALRESGVDYMGGLGRRTRYQLRRSMKEYEKRGPLAIDEAPDMATARAYLGRLKELHQRQWQARGLPGSFANDFFVRFHDRLVEDGVGSGVVQLLRVSAGQSELGYLYNHVYRGRVYVYQTGFDYSGAGAYNRPGVVSHLLAIQHNLNKGHAAYDFSAGDSEYKRVLSNASETLAWLVVQAPRMRFKLEDALRRLRRRFAPAPGEAAAAGGQDDASSAGEGAER